MSEPWSWSCKQAAGASLGALMLFLFCVVGGDVAMTWLKVALVVSMSIGAGIACMNPSKRAKVPERAGAQGFPASSHDNPEQGEASEPREDEEQSPEKTQEQDELCYKADAYTCAVELAIVDQVNQLRGNAEPLRYSKSLSFIAREWSRVQAQSGGIGHQGFPGQRLQAFYQEFGRRDVRMASENVAYTHVGGGDAIAAAAALTRMWWNSSGHRRNMLSSQPFLGIGVHRAGSQLYGTQIFGSASE